MTRARKRLAMVGITFMVQAIALAVSATAQAASAGLGQKQKDGGGSGDAALQIGDRLEDFITSNTQPLLIAVAGAMGFTAFGQRQSGRLAAITMLTIGVGGFVYAPASIENIVKSLWGVID